MRATRSSTKLVIDILVKKTSFPWYKSLQYDSYTEGVIKFSFLI